MKSLILFLLFIILVPIALSSLLAMYILAKVAILYICEKVTSVYRYASGKMKDNETPAEDHD